VFLARETATKEHTMTNIPADSVFVSSMDTDNQVWVQTPQGGLYAYRTELIYSVARNWTESWNRKPPADVPEGTIFIRVASTGFGYGTPKGADYGEVVGYGRSNVRVHWSGYGYDTDLPYHSSRPSQLRVLKETT
jgi:hypothetical protein